MYLAASLLAVLLLVVAIVVWQHASRSGESEATFGVLDAVEFILPRLDPTVSARLGRQGVQRILEWEIYYLQGLAQPDRRQPVTTVAGDYQPAIDYITAQIALRHGASYPAPDVAAVLRQEVAYLAEIGAIGDEVGGDDR
jgi:hypothetical protein